VIPASTAGGTHWSRILDSASSLDPMRRLQMVNDFANRMPYVEDIDNYGLRDFWAKTDTFFEIGGDCEDFALAKYKLLHRIGFHADRMRVVLVVDNKRRRQHAVLAVYTGGQAWMLDSLMPDVVPHQTAPQYRPTISLSGPRLYLHVPPKA
jgi:predicted transglutaminase-like cysteine proteinase